ncbi:hypothetical protein PIB30_029559 [Stylosanthes scabra]|uniref:Uncharacterized protein n=1 Tax=Stylosanthes scabra TaxID=79078 RepID=A0ABU6W9D8_9FABA|nr:hypothetical protein [Stylosanthes scabra]
MSARVWREEATREYREEEEAWKVQRSRKQRKIRPETCSSQERKRRRSSLPFAFVRATRESKTGDERFAEEHRRGERPCRTMSVKRYAQWGKGRDSGTESKDAKRDVVYDPIVGRDKKIDEGKNMALPYIKGKVVDLKVAQSQIELLTRSIIVKSMESMEPFDFRRNMKELVEG